MENNRDERVRDARYTTIDGHAVDHDGKIVIGSSGWSQHPQASRATRRLQPTARIDQGQMQDERQMRYDEGIGMQQPSVNVNVTNAGQYYRPWKEELLISGWRTVGNFIAWPFRLVGNLLGGVLRLALMAIVLPAMLFGSISFYQSHKNESAGAMAHEIGRSGVGIVGSALHGIWDGIFGSGEKPVEPKRTQAPAADDSSPAATKDR